MSTHKDILSQFKRLNLSEGHGMALLAQRNIISDNCVRVWDIYRTDIQNVVTWLQARKPQRNHNDPN